MDLAYLITPFAAWLMAGGLKFAVNSARSRSLAFDLIGYGGFPSTHASIVSGAVMVIGLRAGWDNPVLAVALALALIVCLDATGLRKHISDHAKVLNQLTPEKKRLRERIGHSLFEILGGILTGVVTAWLINLVV